jgi:hypothetical protein
MRELWMPFEYPLIVWEETEDRKWWSKGTSTQGAFYLRNHKRRVKALLRHGWRLGNIFFWPVKNCSIRKTANIFKHDFERSIVLLWWPSKISSKKRVKIQMPSGGIRPRDSGSFLYMVITNHHIIWSTTTVLPRDDWLDWQASQTVADFANPISWWLLFKRSNEFVNQPGSVPAFWSHPLVRELWQWRV